MIFSLLLSDLNRYIDLNGLLYLFKYAYNVIYYLLYHLPPNFIAGLTSYPISLVEALPSKYNAP